MTWGEAVRGLVTMIGVALTGVVWACAMIVAVVSLDGVDPQDYGVGGRAAVSFLFLGGVLLLPFLAGASYVVARAFRWSVPRSCATSQVVTVACAAALTAGW